MGDWIIRHQSKVITLRDTQRFHPRVERDALEAGLLVLEERGFIRRRPAPAREGPGRRPSPAWDVSPMVADG